MSMSSGTASPYVHLSSSSSSAPPTPSTDAHPHLLSPQVSCPHCAKYQAELTIAKELLRLEQQQVATLRENAAKQEAAIAKHEETITKLQLTIAELSGTIKANNQLHTALQSEINTLNSAVSNQTQQISNQTQQINNQTQQINNQAQELHALRNQDSEKSKKIEELSNAFKRLEKRMDQASQAARQQDEAHQDTIDRQNANARRIHAISMFGEAARMVFAAQVGRAATHGSLTHNEIWNGLELDFARLYPSSLLTDQTGFLAVHVARTEDTDAIRFLKETCVGITFQTLVVAFWLRDVRNRQAHPPLGRGVDLIESLPAEFANHGVRIHAIEQRAQALA
ncbi:hypothetical protein CAOG_06547 [Capsaspora owczarzaki ATCC 30864]|uniref:Uncharacterized protein n=1 Tax=Capsaspora owczarzaki (strain ATCC 30864) TaxID=595528 RepID=A0A0D2WVH5_CAPO3|nr:hypothetical protein CAOG_06547 [Capsaspora owczarzaki ATCC 30864]KJE96188.1 hypothetical protein CAOG_006547 [Capsaspora owczarzaki ATCC 30864]|eukprot:XP_004345296.1 hypothetical protein CAOG_06547 [Capsaspora owczarzaki ATCC 30864]